MYLSVRELFGYDINVKDGEIGHVEDFFFEHPQWVLRYLVVDTSSWELERQVLLSVCELGEPDREEVQIPVSLDKAQLKDSPEIGDLESLTREHEIMLHDYYGWHRYWLDEKRPSTPAEDSSALSSETVQQANPHLYQTSEVFGYTILTRDGVAGFVYDFLVDSETWETDYLIVDTGVWLQNRKVMFAPSWVEVIDDEDEVISVDLSRATIKNSPEYDPEQPVIQNDEET